MNTRSSKCDQSAADSQRDLDEHNVAVHVAAPAYGVLTRRELRRLLDRLLPTIGELDAFILDFFPKVFHEFGDGSARTPRLNLLLQYAPEAELTACLQREYPQEVAAALAQRTGLSVNPRVPDTKTVTITLTLSGDVQVGLTRFCGQVGYVDEGAWLLLERARDWRSNCIGLT